MSRSWLRCRARTVTVKIESLDRKSFIVLRFEERGDDRLPSRRLAIESQLGDFSGHYDHVWVEQAQLERFVAEVKQLERTRRGSAALEAMSPEELLLRINVIDVTGRVAVTVQLRRQGYVGQKHQRFGVEGGFELEPSTLPALVRELSDLSK
jgi:hypothetical protein